MKQYFLKNRLLSSPTGQYPIVSQLRCELQSLQDLASTLTSQIAVSLLEVVNFPKKFHLASMIPVYDLGGSPKIEIWINIFRYNLLVTF